jgi:hypothetical protein
MNLHKGLYLILLLNTIHYDTNAAFFVPHSFSITRETVFNILCLALGLTGTYGVVRMLHAKTRAQKSDQQPPKTAVVLPTSTACLLISILALSFPPAWAQ